MKRNPNILSRLLFILGSFALFVLPTRAQRLNFITSTPKVEAYPIVRFHMTASYNGSVPTPGVLPSDITINEDGVPMTPELLDCDESNTAAVAFCVDVSTSMRSSVGDGFDLSYKFFQAFGPCISQLQAPSRYALITFNDSINGVYPSPSHPTGFFLGGNAADSQAFGDALALQPYFGGTYVDHAIDKAMSMLEYQPFQHKAIVLVTDDAILDFAKYDSLFEANHITLYVMEVGSDNSPHNVALAHSTGGVYYQAQDSNDWSPVMKQLGELVTSEHCTLRYHSNNPCPWYANHIVDMSLTYKGLTRTSTEYFQMGVCRNDTDGPEIIVGQPLYTSRLVTVYENFPCGRGLMYASDSAVSNFILLKRRQTFVHFFPKINGVYPDSSYMSMTDSLIVADSMSNARVIYVARDSAGNKSGVEVLYSPAPDTLPPVVTVSQSSAGKYVLNISEIRPWDRGIKQIRLAAGASNIVLDQTQIFSKRLGNAWVHIIDPTLPVYGCIEAIDSAGNMGQYCIDRSGGAQDTLPPVIAQYPVVSPIKTITGQVTELRPRDKGIRDIVIESVPNIGSPTYAFISPYQANFSVSIIDSLQPVRAQITSSDSLGNAALDTLRYDPQADTNGPNCQISVLSPTSSKLRVTEFAPWDRGVASITVLGTPTNMSVGPVTFVSVLEAEQTFTAIDPTQTASLVVKATDSVGHECVNTITISPSIIPLYSFASSGDVDFLSHIAPFDSTATIVITNPNEVPVIVTKLIQTGDQGTITSDLKNPIVFQGLEQVPVHIRLNTGLIGHWQSTFSLANDTMPLVKINVAGTTTGMVNVHVDTAFTAHSQMPGMLHITITAQPIPINIDTLSFGLTYDGDFIQTSAPTFDCSGNNPLCNYNVQFSNPTDGTMNVTLIRQDRNILSAFEDTAATIDLPFTTFVARNNSSVVSVVGVSSPLTDPSVANGFVSIGDLCGDPTLRAYLNDRLLAAIGGIVPNPASHSATVSIVASQANIDATVSVIDGLGNFVRRIPVHLAKGTNAVAIEVSDLPSGNYILALNAAGSNCGSIPLVILR
ncbi:MAG: VWA domain-containing protein [Bacteroidetes bacterium]|nr:VWA domain-containing protein [Bacteroidota bacterium]